MTQEIRANLVVNHHLDHYLCPRSRIRNLRVSKRTVGSSYLQEAEQRFNTPVFEGRRNLMLSRYSVCIRPGYVGCRIRQAGIESYREVWGPLRQLLVKVLG